MKIRMRILLYILFCSLLSSCNGIFYPNVVFIAHPKGESPPFSSKKRLDLGSKYEQELTVLLQRVGNDFNNSLRMSVFVQKPYEKLHIEKISYRTNSKELILFQDLNYTLPKKIRMFDEKSNVPSYITKNRDYYWCSIDVTNNTLKKVPSVKLYEHFKEYKLGTKSDIELIIKYSFDNEDSKILNLMYTIEVREGRYVSSFMGR